ncbi:MAG: hypothetical protein R3E89_11290 [Thiolinea sp.]
MFSATFLSRPVATVYKIKGSDTTSEVACRRAPTASASVMTTLRPGQRVDLVSLEEGMLETGGEFWLHVYPPLSHRPSCYINTRYLIPYA